MSQYDDIIANLKAALEKQIYGKLFLVAGRAQALNKIHLIKAHRQVFSTGLKEAKHAVEAMLRAGPQEPIFRAETASSVWYIRAATLGAAERKAHELHNRGVDWSQDICFDSFIRLVKVQEIIFTD